MDYVEPLPIHNWLAESFFRLHRRRQIGQHGYQPLPYQEMADFAERILKLHPEQADLFYLTMEETDNAILYDQHMQTKAEADAAEKALPLPKPRKRK